MSDTTTLYRLYDDAGALLYVGISAKPFTRLAQHGREKEWWAQVATTTLEHHATRAHALAAEAQAIRAERPRHNVMGVGTTQRGERVRNPCYRCKGEACYLQYDDDNLIHLSCKRCDTAGDMAWHVELERLRDEAAWLDIYRHLMGKTWVAWYPDVERSLRNVVQRAIGRRLTDADQQRRRSA